MALIGDMQYLTIGSKTYRIASSSLPIASASTLGGIKVGTGLTIDSTTGVLSATGTSVTIDNALSGTSTNPVQNKVIKEALDNKANTTNIPTKTSDLTNDSGFMTGMTILSYGSSTWNDFLTAYQANHVVYCRASSNANPASGSQTRMAFMAYVSNATNPANVEFQYYRSMSSHTDDDQGDEVYVYKLTNGNSWSVTTRKTYTKILVSNGISKSVTSGTAATLTLSLADAYGDTKNPYGTKNANTVLAGPTSGTAAVPSFRALVASDIPDLSSIYLTSFTETDPVFSASDAASIVFGSSTSQYLANNGTWQNLPQGTAYSAGTGLSLSGTTFNHSNSVTAQTTQAVYPIKIDAQGHISDYGSAVTSMPASDVYNWAKASTKPTYTASEVGAATESHTHGYLKNDGTFSSQMPIANGDYLVVADHSNSDKLCYTTLAFDGSTTTKALTQKGTWETFLQTEQYTGTVTGVKINGTTKSPSSGIVDIGTVATSDTDTTYSLSNVLSSHKFTWTFTAGGSGSGSTTTTAELVAGTGISLTDDTTNKKITIASTVTDTDEKVKVTQQSVNSVYYYPILTPASEAGSATTKVYSNAFKGCYSASGDAYQGYLGTNTGIVGKLLLGNSANSWTTITTSGTAARTITLPDATGTVALTSQIPSVSGFITSAVLTGTYNSTSKNLTLSITTS